VAKQRKDYRNNVPLLERNPTGNQRNKMCGRLHYEEYDMIELMLYDGTIRMSMSELTALLQNGPLKGLKDDTVSRWIRRRKEMGIFSYEEITNEKG